MKIDKETAIKIFTAHSQMSKAYRAKITSSIAVIKNSIAKYKKPYLAFSGGKDSLVILDLVYRVTKKITIVHKSQGEYMPPAIQNEIDNIIESYDVEKVIYTDRTTNFKIDGLKLKEQGYDLCFVGCRRDESCARRIRHDKHISIGGMKEIWPVAYWSYKDIWAYIFENALKYVSTYDLYCPALGWDNARFHNFFASGTNTGDRFGMSNIDRILMSKHYKEMNL